jgi:hypothetical protein
VYEIIWELQPARRRERNALDEACESLTSEERPVSAGTPVT